MWNQNLMRRTLVGLGGGTAVAVALGTNARTLEPKRWQPTSEPQDRWLDRVGGRHRLVFDTVSAGGLGAALRYADSYFAANQSAYGIDVHDLAVVIILRHLSTPLAYSDAIWGKYGAVLSERLKLVDPRTKAPPTVNLYDQALKDESLTNGGITIGALAQKGVRFAVCATATKGIAGILADKVGGTADAVFAELTSALIPNGLMVPAGIVAVNRAQEHGYAISYAG